MTKEEKTKEAWGTLMPDYTRIDLDDGWSIGLFWCQDIDSDKYDTWDMSGCWCCIRPKSLQGIENNNGWIKIESEADLPKETGHFWVCSKINNQIEVDYIDWDYESNAERWMEFNSYYQPIEKPLKPIY